VNGSLYWKKFTQAVTARDCPSSEHPYDAAVPKIFSELSPRIPQQRFRIMGSALKGRLHCHTTCELQMKIALKIFAMGNSRTSVLNKGYRNSGSSALKGSEIRSRRGKCQSTSTCYS
jgi:hypothetical protein